MKIIKQQTKDGKAIDYRVDTYLDEVTVKVRVNGKPFTEATPEVVNAAINGRHVYGKIANVQIGNEQVWNEIMAAYTETKDALESSDEYKVKKLRQQREKLARELSYSRDEAHEAHQRQVEAMSQGGRYHHDADQLQADINAARAALKAFDEAHPEITEGVRKERDERTERNMWN